MRALIDGIKGIIPGGISVMDFAIIAKIDQVTSKNILNELIANDIGKKNQDLFIFSNGDRLKTAIFALKNGADIDRVAENISWRNFEGLVAEILQMNDFDVVQNFMLKKPRMEIDVIGKKLGVALLIDCKHWKRYSTSALCTIVKKQIQRTKHYVSSAEDISAIPVIVTLYQDKMNFIDNVPIVSILQFSSFIDEFYGSMDQIKTIKKD